MTYPRAHLVDPDTPGFYHLISRCVRRAWLCGEDPLTGRSYDHRRGWIEQRMLFLARRFAIDIHGYAIMNNHYHLVVRVDPKAPDAWSELEVAERWTSLTPPRPPDSEQQMQRKLEQLLESPDRIVECRRRLGDVSWFMRFLNERIAREANAEDECKGRFWEGRFKSYALLDEHALYACMTYVDLNPFRAGIAERLEDARYTSARRRIAEANVRESEDASPWGRPLAPVASGLGNRGTVLGLALSDYVSLVEWTAMKPAADVGRPGIVEKLRIDGNGWLLDVRQHRRRDRRAFGSAASLDGYVARLGQKRLRRGIQTAHTSWPVAA